MASVNEKETKGSPVGTIVKGLVVTGLAVGAAALANAYIVYKTPPLLSALEGGEVRYFPTPDGDIFYKKRGDGPPLLLVHAIGAGCSSFEFRHVWKELSEKYTVYALDLLGFGKSDKPNIPYDPETFIGMISDFCKTVIGVGDGRGEADVIATSLSAAYIIALSQRDPLLFRRLVLVCPTGIEELAEPVNAGSAAVKGLLRTPVLGTTFYNGVTSRAGVRKYLVERIYADPSKVTPEVVDAYYTAAHQPGADGVLPYFLSGYMNINVADLFPGVVDLPLIVWGREAKESPLTLAEPFLRANKNAKLEVVDDAGALPHDEQPEAFLAAVRPFLFGAPDEDPEAVEVSATVEPVAVGSGRGSRRGAAVKNP